MIPSTLETRTKPWWTSKTMWGGIMLAVYGAAKSFGFEVGESDQAEITDMVVAIVDAAWLIVGAVLTIWGRIAATTRITAGRAAPLIALAIVAGMAAGCAMTPQQRVLNAREAYTSTLNILSTYRAAGRIDDATYRQIEQARALAAEALDEAEQAAVAGGGVHHHLAAFDRAMDRLIAWRIAIEEADRDTTGDPAGGESSQRNGAVPDEPGGATAAGGPRSDARRGRDREGAAASGRADLAIVGPARLRIAA